MKAKIFPMVMILIMVMSMVGAVSANEGGKIKIESAVWDGNDLIVTLNNKIDTQKTFFLNFADNADGHGGTEPVNGTIDANTQKLVTMVNAPTNYKFLVVNTEDPGEEFGESNRNDKIKVPEKPKPPVDNETNETNNNETPVTPTEPVTPQEPVEPNTVPMQTTGAPFVPAVIGFLSVLAGIGLAAFRG